jgi:TRAP-type C4-dicarboxylate transport system substrate-binding protein
MTQFRLLLATLVLAGLGLQSSLSGAVIKMGTLVPSGTSYHKILMGLSETWRKESGGSVELKIFAGGKAGGEAEMVALMMQNNLQASLLTAVGLAEIERAVIGVQQIPMAFRDFEEVDYVVEHLRPILEARLAEKGFVVLFWSDGGWIHFFSKEAGSHPDDFRRMKTFTWSGNVEQAEAMRRAGFKPVPIETADIVPSLQSGLIDCVPLPPFFALAAQVDTRAPHLLTVNWAPLVGACIVRKESWERIPAELRGRLAAAAAKAGAEMKAVSRRESKEAIVAMQKRGLVVVNPTAEVEAEWRAVAESVYGFVRGGMVPPDIFDEVQRLVAEHRRVVADREAGKP